MDKDKHIKELERYIRELKQQLADTIVERDNLKSKNLQITPEGNSYRAIPMPPYAILLNPSNTSSTYKKGIDLYNDQESYFKKSSGEENGY